MGPIVQFVIHNAHSRYMIQSLVCMKVDSLYTAVHAEPYLDSLHHVRYIMLLTKLLHRVSLEKLSFVGVCIPLGLWFVGLIAQLKDQTIFSYVVA